MKAAPVTAPQNLSNSFQRPIALVSLGALVAMSGLVSDVSAQERQEIKGSINVEKFGTAPGPRNFWVTRGARSDGENAFSLGFLAHYGYKPFVVESQRVSDGFISDVLVVENIVTADVLASYTPTPALQLGLRLPVTYVKGQGLDPNGVAGELAGDGIESTGLSDPEIEVKYRFVGEAQSTFAMAGTGFVTAPLGEATAKGAMIGNESFTGGLRLIADLTGGPFSVAANVGYHFQKEGVVGTSTIGSEALFGLAAGLNAGPVFQVVGDVFGTSALSGEAGTNTLETAVGAKITPLNSGLTISFGGGPGVVHSVGGPIFRAFVGLSYVSESMDADLDGVDDKADLCPTDAEDMDGYEDSDGCPDLDNDGDAIADSADKCPDEAEDGDKFEDLDGCPDLDNDKDKLPDVSDRCPDEPETYNGFEDEDGCPDVPDTDGDGVDDPNDKCPEEPEDTDGYEDTDGCPDPDNDGDGIPDDRDECVDEAEDMNGVEDEDGCPEDGEASAPTPAPKRRPPSGGGAPREGSEDNPIEL